MKALIGLVLLVIVVLPAAAILLWAFLPSKVASDLERKLLGKEPADGDRSDPDR